MTKALTTIKTDLEVTQLGDILVQSGFFSDSRSGAQAVVKVLAGQELGFGPIASMTGVNIIKGRVAISANLLAAAIKRTGRYTYRIREHSDEVCTIAFIEDGEEVGESSFTVKDAAKAGLTSNPTWAKYPRNMLFARALSNGAKWFCPDIFGGPIYTPEELGAEVNEDGEVIEGNFSPRTLEPQPEPTPEPEQTSESQPEPAAKKRQSKPAPKSSAPYDPADDKRTYNQDIHIGFTGWLAKEQVFGIENAPHATQAVLISLKHVGTLTDEQTIADLYGAGLSVADVYSAMVQRYNDKQAAA